MYKFSIIKKPYGYVVVNKDLDTHAHMDNFKGCICLIRLIKKNVDIKDPYLRRAKERLIPQR